MEMTSKYSPRSTSTLQVATLKTSKTSLVSNGSAFPCDFQLQLKEPLLSFLPHTLKLDS